MSKTNSEKNKFCNQGGMFGIVMGLLFGWFPVVVVMTCMGLTTLTQEQAIIAFSVSYAISLPSSFVLFSYFEWKDGLV